MTEVRKRTHTHQPPPAIAAISQTTLMTETIGTGTR